MSRRLVGSMVLAAFVLISQPRGSFAGDPFHALELIKPSQPALGKNFTVPGLDSRPLRLSNFNGGDKVQRLPKDQLPEFAGTGEIGRLYRYAVQHGDELQYIPCLCGCVRFGHKSNRDCYIKAFHQDGTLTFTSHSAT